MPTSYLRAQAISARPPGSCSAATAYTALDDANVTELGAKPRASTACELRINIIPIALTPDYARWIQRRWPAVKWNLGRMVAAALQTTQPPQPSADSGFDAAEPSPGMAAVRYTDFYNNVIQPFINWLKVIAFALVSMDIEWILKSPLLCANS